jgi:hypothetical protein
VHNPRDRRDPLIREDKLYRNPIVIHTRVSIRIGQPNPRLIEVLPVPQSARNSLAPGSTGRLNIDFDDFSRASQGAARSFHGFVCAIISDYDDPMTDTGFGKCD